MRNHRDEGPVRVRDLFLLVHAQVAHAGMSLVLLMSPCKEELPRQPIFNSSALRCATFSVPVSSISLLRKKIWLWLTAFVKTATHRLL